ncbi:MAG: ABC transporter ATP-binding protein [Candidatus Methanomethylophilaceae archaeon]|nr:ABC transporter ATP-binding protein [Candidatus Methanomethylophilaceae archaeon]
MLRRTFGLDVLERLGRYAGDEVRKMRKYVLLSILSTVVISVIPAICGNFLQNLIKIDAEAPELDAAFAVSMCTVIVLLITTWYTTGMHATRELNMMGLKLGKRIRNDLDEIIMRMPIGDLDRMPAGDVTSRFINDVPALVNLVSQEYSAFVTSNLMIVSILVIMFFVSPILSVIYLVSLPLTIAIARSITKMSAEDFETEKRAMNEMNSDINDIVSSHRDIKIMNLEKTMEDRFEESNLRYVDSIVRARTRSGFLRPLSVLSFNLGYVGTAVAGALMIFNSDIAPGMFLAFMVYVRLINKPLLMTARTFDSIRNKLVSADRVLDLLETRLEDESGSTRDMDIGGRVTFEDVSFSYVEGHEVLHHLSFDIEPGTTVALVGPNGCGKSTTINLLMRFYHPDSGRVLIDGVDVEGISRESLGRNIGAVMQDPWIFDGTIRENIVYNRDWVTDEDVRRAVEMTGLSGYTDSLPSGLETIIGDDIHTLPLAQKRMIAMARAVVGDPEILILDETLSGLDPITESMVLEGLKRTMADRTVIVVGHDPLLIRSAEKTVSLA